MNFIALRVVAAFSALCLLHGTAVAAGEQVDIVGIRLGMTVDEVKAAITKYNPNLAIQPPVQKLMKYRVANETRKTEPFISHLFAVSGKKQKDDIYVYFSAPPGEPRAIAISRLHNNFDPPILRDTYYKALVDKYGKPDATEVDRHKDEKRKVVWLQWHVGDGRTQCVPHIPGGREVDGAFGTLGRGNVEQGQVLLRIRHQNTGEMIVPAAKSPADCAALLTYQLNYDPLFAADGLLIDVAAAARSEEALAAWIDGLVQQGEAEIRGSTAAPKL